MAFISLTRKSDVPSYDGTEVVVNSKKIMCMFPDGTGTMIQFSLEPDQYIRVKEAPNQILACVPEEV